MSKFMESAKSIPRSRSSLKIMEKRHDAGQAFINSCPPPPRIFVLTLFFLLLLPIARVKAASITVSGECTLAEAIANANNDNNGNNNGCAAGSGADVITLTGPFPNNTITLTAALPNITSSITIEGAGKTISGNNQFRIFRINSGTVRINNLTLRNGRADDVDGSNLLGGGAIYTHYGTAAALTVSKSRFFDNVAPEAEGQTSCATGYGGAIVAFGTGGLTILDSVFRGNRAVNNAAVSAGTATTLTIRRSSFTGHGKPDDAPVACQDDISQVIVSRKTGSVISNVTISDNSATGIYVTEGTTTISHSTIVNNDSTNENFGAGINQYDPQDNRAARVKLYNNIIANNVPFNCRSGSHDLAVWITANVNNLVKTRIVESVDSNGNITRTEHDDCGTPAISDDPMLASFRGAPGYHPLLQGSPAIDAAPDDVNCLDTDIRGVARPHGDRCDLGAYEGFLVPPPSAEPGRGSGGEDPAAIDRSVCAFCPELLAQGYRLKATYGLESGVQFRRVDAGAIGDQSLLAAGFLDAINVYGYAEQGVGVCFPAAGRLLFLDAAFSPRAVMSPAAYSQDGMSCADFDRPGTLLLLPGPAPSAAPALGQCMVTTDAILNFRESPGGPRLHFVDVWGAEIAGWLPQGVTLTALQRTPDWFLVDYHGTRGWVSAHHVTPHGTCG